MFKINLNKKTYEIAAARKQAENTAKIANLQAQQKKVQASLKTCWDNIKQVQETLETYRLTDQETTLAQMREQFKPITEIAVALKVTTENCQEIFRRIVEKRDARIPLQTRLESLQQEHKTLSVSLLKIKNQIEEERSEWVEVEPETPAATAAPKRVTFNI